MIKIIFYLLFLVALFLWISDAKIGFRPFTFSVPSWRWGIGWILICLGMSFVKWQGKKDGFKAGYGKARDQIINIIQDEYKNQQNSQL